jgi:hypothetical protein
MSVALRAGQQVHGSGAGLRAIPSRLGFPALGAFPVWNFVELVEPQGQVEPRGQV